ncbi:GIY-YIG nuclease family protein [Fusobacterium sp. PH5-44]|uniref:GIY-YIG nuclease family protein n=1 Tax=unclassified Fusobacterium TaxID=2648384 RepID=UPI003D1D4C6C
MEKIYYVYMLRTKIGTLYTGITTDVIRRLSEHINNEKGAKYTKGFKIIKIELVLETIGRSNASKIEYYIKKLTKEKKEIFIKNPISLSQKISEDLNIFSIPKLEFIKEII